ncbi:MAG TPA: catalase family peroxidase [Rhodanobacteraceae bacterium]|nr:catalase family peroxidase [Rhodanobacteraceae bacterium]
MKLRIGTVSYLALAALVGIAGGVWAAATETPSQEQPATPTPGAMVDALHAAFGDHHTRAVHAKGVYAVGEYRPSAAARRLSKASLFRSQNIPVLVRFSDFTGIPDIPDTAPQSMPRGMALKFNLPGGHTADVVAHSFNGFPTANTAEFRELLFAIAASGQNTPKPTPLDQFLAAHPVAKAFLTTQKPMSESYATLDYYGVNAFRFTDDAGASVFVRYRFVPVDGERFVPAAKRASMGPDYLAHELPGRLSHGAVAYRWLAQIAAPGDAIDNPSIAWPESRRLIDLGTIRITGMAPNPAALDRQTVFLPLNVPDGIAGADPMLDIRQHAYPISFAHRRTAQPAVARRGQ